MVRPVFWFLLGFVLVMLIFSGLIPALTLVVAAVIVIVSLVAAVALLMFVGWVDERSEGSE